MTAMVAANTVATGGVSQVSQSGFATAGQGSAASQRQSVKSRLKTLKTSRANSKRDAVRIHNGHLDNTEWPHRRPAVG
jgi:hypothetical protein